MRTRLSILFLVLMPTLAWGQELASDTTKHKAIQIDDKRIDLRPTDNSKSKNKENIEFSIEAEEASSTEAVHQQDLKYDTLLLKQYVGPALENKYKPFTFNPYTNPFANDYIYRALYRIDKNTQLTSLSQRMTVPALLDIRLVSVSIHHSPVDWLDLSLGTTSSKYVWQSGGLLRSGGDGSHMYTDISVHGAANFRVHERMSFTVFGQYAVQGKLGAFGSPVVGGETHYGGTVNMKVHPNFEMKVGVKRFLNPYTGKWKMQPIIAPVIMIR